MERNFHRELLAEIVEEGVLPLDSQRVQHVHAGLEHHRQAAQVALDVLWRRMRTEVFVEHHLTDEAGIAGPAVLGKRLRQRQMPLECFVRLRDGVEVIDVERLTEAARATSVGDLSGHVQTAELIADI